MARIVNFSMQGTFRRGLALLPLVLALAGGWFSVRWYAGNTIASNLNSDDRALETARLAAALAPADPVTHWALAEIEQTKLPLDQTRQSLLEYDRAAGLSPNDYRFWLSLGRALEQSGDTQKAEKAMNRAVELAPAYAYPRWYLGNLLLRNGNDTQAFTNLRLAGAADPQLQSQVFNLLWEARGNNPAALDLALGAMPGVRADFAKYLLDRQKIDDGLRIWGAMTPQEKQAHRTTGQLLTGSLVAAKRYRPALEIWNSVVPSDSGGARMDHFFNGGFEQNTDGTSGGPFAWQVKSMPQAQVGLDTAGAHGGGHSLRLLFKAPARIEASISQLIVVDSNTQYDLECFLKTSRLESAATPAIEILDAADGKPLSNSIPAPAGDNDWQRISLSFKTAPKTEAILIRIYRSSCEGSSVCPIFGTVWYDDFDLKRRG